MTVRAAVVLCLVSISASAQTQPYQRTQTSTGACLYLPSKSLVWHVDSVGNPETTAETEFTAISAAFTSWKSSVQGCSDFTFVEGGKVLAPKVEHLTDGGTNRNVIIFRQKACKDVVNANDPCLINDNCNNAYNCWQHGSEVLALPTTTFKQSTGEVLDVDIELNAAGFVFTTVDSPKCVSPNFNQSCVATDVQNVMTATIGQAIGLSLVSDPMSTMSSSSQPGETSKRVIDPGTRDGFCAIYPAGKRPTLCDGGSTPEPLDAGLINDAGVTCSGEACMTQKPGCGCSAAEPGTLLLAALMMLLRRRA